MAPGQACDRVLQVAADVGCPDVFHNGPVGVHCLVGVGLNMAQVVGGYLRTGGLDGRGPGDGQRSGAGGDGVHGGGAGRGCVAVDGEAPCFERAVGDGKSVGDSQLPDAVGVFAQVSCRPEAERPAQRHEGDKGVIVVGVGVEGNGQLGDGSGRRLQLDFQVPERAMQKGHVDLDELGEAYALSSVSSLTTVVGSPVSGASGIRTLVPLEFTVELCSAGALVHPSARATAAPASATPKPYSWLK